MAGETFQQVAYGSDLHAETLSFRDEHLRKPLGLTTSEVDVAGEETQIHLAALADGLVVATVVLKPLGDRTIKLRQMAVSPERRGDGLGRRLIAFAEEIARQREVLAIEMSARASAQGFYERLGYQVEGEPFTEVTIPHVRMVKRL